MHSIIYRVRQAHCGHHEEISSRRLWMTPVYMHPNLEPGSMNPGPEASPQKQEQRKHSPS